MRREPFFFQISPALIQPLSAQSSEKEVKRTVVKTTVKEKREESVDPVFFFSLFFFAIPTSLGSPLPKSVGNGRRTRRRRKGRINFHGEERGTPDEEGEMKERDRD